MPRTRLSQIFRLKRAADWESVCVKLWFYSRKGQESIAQALAHARQHNVLVLEFESLEWDFLTKDEGILIFDEPLEVLALDQSNGVGRQLFGTRRRLPEMRFGQHQLAKLFDKGFGGLPKAIELYQKAAEQDHSAAQSALGVKYALGAWS